MEKEPKKKKKHGCLTAIIVVIVLFFIFSLIPSGGSDSKKETETKEILVESSETITDTQTTETVEETKTTETETVKETKATEAETVKETKAAEVSTEAETIASIYSNISNDDYAKMLDEYDAYLSEQMSVITDQGGSALSDKLDSISTDDLQKMVDQLTEAEANLRNRYKEIDKNRTAAPMGTKIMTMFSAAQSAVPQYKLAIQHMIDYKDYGKQKYLDDMKKYFDKADESMKKYNEALTSQKEALQEK